MKIIDVKRLAQGWHRAGTGRAGAGMMIRIQALGVMIKSVDREDARVLPTLGKLRVKESKTVVLLLKDTRPMTRRLLYPRGQQRAGWRGWISKPSRKARSRC